MDNEYDHKNYNIDDDDDKYCTPLKYSPLESVPFTNTKQKHIFNRYYLASSGSKKAEFISETIDFSTGKVTICYYDKNTDRDSGSSENKKCTKKKVYKYTEYYEKEDIEIIKKLYSN